MLCKHTSRFPRSTQLLTQRFSYAFDLVISGSLNILTSSDDFEQRRLCLEGFLSSVLNPPISAKGGSENSPFTDKEINALVNTLLALPQEVYFKITRALNANSFSLNLTGTKLADLLFPFLRAGVDGNETLTKLHDLYFPIVESVIGAIVGLSYLYALAKFEAENTAKSLENTNSQQINPIDFLDKFFGQQAEDVKAVVQKAISEEILVDIKTQL